MAFQEASESESEWEARVQHVRSRPPPPPPPPHVHDVGDGHPANIHVRREDPPVIRVHRARSPPFRHARVEDYIPSRPPSIHVVPEPRHPGHAARATSRQRRSPPPLPPPPPQLRPENVFIRTVSRGDLESQPTTRATPVHIIEADRPSHRHHRHQRHSHHRHHRPLHVHTVSHTDRAKSVSKSQQQVEEDATTKVSIPEDHDVTEDFFDQGRGMWDFDMLMQESQRDQRRQGAMMAAARQRERSETLRRSHSHRHRSTGMRTQEDNDDSDVGEARFRRLENARDELRWLRSQPRPRRRRRSSSPEGGGTGFAGEGPSGPSGWWSGEDDDDGHYRRRRKKKGKQKQEEGQEEEEEKDGCCEKLLAFLQEDAEIQQYRWLELRDLLLAGTTDQGPGVFRQRSAATRGMSMPQPVPVPPQETTSGTRSRSMAGDTEHTNTFRRPSMLCASQRSGVYSTSSHYQTRSSERRRSSAPRPPPSSSSTERTIKVGFMFLFNGEAVKSRKLHEYTAAKGITERRDAWLIKHMKSFYSRRVASRRWISRCTKRLALAKFVRLEHVVLKGEYVRQRESLGKDEKSPGPDWKWICTAQRWVLNTKDENSYDRFEYTIDHPLCDNRTWMRKLEGMAHMADPENESIMWVYLFERVNYRFIIYMVLVFVLLSTSGGVAFGVLNDDISAGLTISTYVLGMLTVATAIWGAGEHLGVEKPDTYSYSFDTVHMADDITEIGDNDAEDGVRG